MIQTLSAAIVAATLLTSSAIAGSFVVNGGPACTETFEGLPRLAKRLGVKPGANGGEMILHTCKDGDYSLIKLINALLDRMERSAKP
jgi:hypothetical protein